MNVGLFIPCYIEQFYPQVGIATVQLLENLGCTISYPLDQTCCGQPMANTGCEKDAISTYLHFVKTFQKFDFIVSPSGSCTYHVRKYYDNIEQTEDVKKVRENIVDLPEFLLDVLKLESLDVEFPHKVGLHHSCHGLRGLRLGQGSERVGAPFSRIQQLLLMVKGLEIIELSRADECCGFGGTFSINEPAISAKMGKDRIKDHMQNGAEVITAGDMSCLMHLEGITRRQKHPVRMLHFVEILNGVKI
ncbi:MAG: (Fe-S)-binding protein [Bacteroidetes bacterium]|nr:(Fe-S)-binding protein [Bacteroidota bacterium]